MSHGSEQDALARMRADLAAVGAPPMPAEVNSRIGSALAQAQCDLVGSPDRRHPGLRLISGRAGGTGAGRGARRPGRRKRARDHRAVVAGLVAAAVVAVTAVVVTVGAGAAPRVANEESDLRDAGAGTVGRQGAGALTDPVRRRACLVAAGVPGPESSLLGGRPYAVRGDDGLLLVLGDGVRGRFRLVVVDPGCGPAGGRLLAATTVGR